MAETAALLADEILPERPLRQWVLSLPMALRFLLATRPAVLSAVLGVVYRTISGHLLGVARLTRTTGHTGAVTLIQRFGSALNLNVHLHMIFIDGAYRSDGVARPVFHPVPPPIQLLLGKLNPRAPISQLFKFCGQATGLFDRRLHPFLSFGFGRDRLFSLAFH
jgi:hypothetical protein